MLNVASLDEASLGTMESDALLPPTAAGMNGDTHEDDDDDCISEGSYDAEWRMVTLVSDDNNENTHDNDDDINHTDSGVLILDGEEADINLGGTTAASENGSGTTGTGNGTNGMDLSLGTDSVPTICDLEASIDGLNAPAPVNVHDNLDLNANDVTKEAEMVSASTQTALELNDPAGLAGNSGGAEKKPENIAAIPAYNNKSRLAFFLVPTVALFLAPTIASLHLYRGERNSLLRERDLVLLERDSVLREKDSLLDSVLRLGEEVQSLKDEAERKKREDVFRWDGCQEDSMKHETVFIDNCWLSARANIQLRDCALDVKERAKERAFALSSTLLGGWEQTGNSTTGSYWNIDLFAYNASHTIDDVGESVAKMMRKVDLIGKKLWDATSTKGHAQTTERKDTNGSSSNGSGFLETPSFFSRMETSGKAQWTHTMNDMKSALSTFFSPTDIKAASNSYHAPRSNKSTRPDALDDLVGGITDIVTAAGSMTAAAGDAMVAAAVEKATGLLEFNGSYLDELLEIATQAAQEASLTHAAKKK